jgi:hypothetical protein
MAYVTSNPKRGLTWCGGIVAIVSALASGAPVGAQSALTTSVLEVKSGLYVVSGTPQLTVVEVGSLKSSSDVQIEFRDAADRRLSIGSGRLNRANPVRKQVTAPGGEQVRVIVRINGLVASDASRPIITFQDLAPGLGLVLETEPPCAPRHSVGGGSQGNCGGWQIDQLATGASGPAGSN